MENVEQRLKRIEAKLLMLCERQQIREWYAVEEFARLVRAQSSPAVSGAVTAAFTRRRSSAVGELMRRGRFLMKSCNATGATACCESR